jgi:hypothetical protein
VYSEDCCDPSFFSTIATKDILLIEIQCLPSLNAVGVVLHTYKPSYSGDGGRRIMSLRTAWENLASPYLKNKGKGGVAQLGEHMLSNCEVLDSIPNTIESK